MKKILILLSFVTLNFGFSFSQAQFQLDGAIAALWMYEDLGLNQSLTSEQINHVSGPDTEMDLYQVILQHPGAGRVQLMMKGPKGFLNSSPHKYRTLMIASGFFTGDQSIHLIGNIPNRILVGFEYPHGLTDFQNDPGLILQFVRKTPAQIAIALNWLAKQTWMKQQGLSVMGVSLGGVFMPSGLHLAQRMNVPLEKAIYVCTGVDVNFILQENLKPYTLDILRGPVATALTAPTLLMNPQIHLPYLKLKSLVIQTNQDTVIPRPAQLLLWNNLPAQKREVILPGPHVNADQLDLIKQIQETVLRYDNE